jgi:hypothetical protein
VFLNEIITVNIQSDWNWNTILITMNTYACDGKLINDCVIYKCIYKYVYVYMYLDRSLMCSLIH